MKIFLAATSSINQYSPELLNDCDYILESYLGLRNKDMPDYMKSCEMFLLDSGAFSFMSSSKKKIDWEKYLNDYINFINENDIQYFFELDIDSIVGYETVKRFRKKLEDKTGKKCIPVWHISRGKDDFLKMCDEYDYVAIGASGKNDSGWTRKHPEVLQKLIYEAHKRNTKIHGLGYTTTRYLPKIHFDSVDSTGWLSGARFGIAFKFDGKSITARQRKPGYRMIDPREVDRNNFKEWCKFQKYAKERL